MEKQMKIKFDHVLQFKVALDGIRPPIWRRIQVPCDYSFWDLHVAIQDAMGWLDCHLHLFELRNPENRKRVRIGIPDDDGLLDFRIVAGWEVAPAAFLTLAKRRAKYEYDFGDGWTHTVTLEKIFPREKGVDYPRCVAGKRACPPEDCGGVPGYERVLKSVAHPSGADPELLEWLGGSFDPEKFDPKRVSFDDPLERWRYAFT